MSLPDFIDILKSEFTSEWRKHLYTNLVFKGSGVHAIAYLGALETLDEMGILKQIKRVAGSSAGAIAALLTSFSEEAAEIRRGFNTLVLPKVAQKRAEDDVKRFWELEDGECYDRFFERFGWYSSEYFYRWAGETIAGKCGGNERATFAEFDKRGFRELYISAANITRHRNEVFSAKTTPDVAVVDAVRMSMTIPIVFESLRFDGKTFGAGDYYVDGGLYDNYPMHVFDDPVFEADNLYYDDGINWQTLGLFLYPEERVKGAEIDFPKNVWQYVMLTLENLYESHQFTGYEKNPVDKYRTIEISNERVPIIGFDIEPGDQSYQILYKSGINAVKDFFHLIN